MSFPEWLFNKLQNQYGDLAEEICLISNSPAPATIRVNPLKTTREELLKKLSHLDVVPDRKIFLGDCFKKRLNFFELPEFKSGFFEVQDERQSIAG